MNRGFHTVAWSLTTAAMLGLVGWVYATGNRTTALEVQQSNIEKALTDIRQDIREVRTLLIQHGQRNPDDNPRR